MNKRRINDKRTTTSESHARLGDSRRIKRDQSGVADTLVPAGRLEIDHGIAKNRGDFNLGYWNANESFIA